MNITSALEANANKTEPTDYSKTLHWFYLPVSVEKDIDVFYIMPTAWEKLDKSESDICDIDNPTLLKGAKVAFAVQATAFETVGNIYAPYYRQIDGSLVLDASSDEQDEIVGGVPAFDVIAAFDYYIKHYNNNRPFILAGHSQGAVVMRFLLSKYMKEHPDVYGRMIVAYVIGFSITKDYLFKNPHLKFAEGPDDIGVVVSYNTEAPGFKGKSMVVSPGAIAINPITWTRSEKLATAEESLGSIMVDGDGSNLVTLKNFADARVDKDRGVVVCSTIGDKKLAGVGPGGKFLAEGVYHEFDYQLYYYNIRENAENRTKVFLAKNKPKKG
jgi:hypothetical protein